jgi:murein DD-endopeptidase MepM/ murein hydrolase activator NlpD
VADNKPGEMNRRHPFGNYVILDHGREEFSFLAHFKIDSISVQPGRVLQGGTLLGLCGNSGNSSEPHLHFHLQNSPSPFRGEGLPAFFREYLSNGRHTEKGEPIGGEAVCDVCSI